MRGKIVQVREYTEKPNKFLVVELTDDSGLYEVMKYRKGEVEIEAAWET